MLDWPTPLSAWDVLSFVNTAGVFRNSIENFASIAKPLYDLTTNLRTIEGDNRQGHYKRALERTTITDRWGETENKAFTTLKTRLTTFPVTVGPTYDGSPFYIATDASAIGLGAHLTQQSSSGQIRTIAYASRSTTAQEERLHSSELELLAVKWALDKFSKYVYGQPIVLSTDCQAVKDMLRNDCLTGARAAWKESVIGARIIELKHKPGKENVVADGLSRLAKRNHSTTETVPEWEQWKGLSNSLYDYKPLRRLSVNDDQWLLDWLEDDAHIDIARYSLQKDVDLIPEGSVMDVQARSKTF